MGELNITKAASAFSELCRVETTIRATPEIVWAILTDARNFPRWNSTVTAIEGEIREEGQL